MLMAVKHIPLLLSDGIDTRLDQAKQEIRVMQKLQSPYIVTYLGCQASEDRTGLDIFLEYVRLFLLVVFYLLFFISAYEYQVCAWWIHCVDADPLRCLLGEPHSCLSQTNASWTSFSPL
jgi:hypothetical protein